MLRETLVYWVGASRLSYMAANVLPDGLHRANVNFSRPGVSKDVPILAAVQGIEVNLIISIDMALNRRVDF